ncbi:hypothetical protein BJF81_15115 [Ornithinimicrobium sp. CNJ-824]|uniref:hypothetical protein n=1 Tax=Ornithinimicrobium sp. CNJ-824 TaxID=1904966 RepID=UPI00095F04FC|nr:hypothetical protein [Ornithinimicrobium sp. CNJ-824]OLT21678.1 hypothetical protein BJF81_15115 [Ornithinimicrobium sp. CNJ-824]
MPLDLDEGAALHITWTPYPGMGNGAGLDWSQLPEVLQWVRDNWPLVEAYLAARGAAEVVLDDTKRVQRLMSRGAAVIQERMTFWDRAGAHVSDIAGMLSFANKDKREIAEMLGLDVEDVDPAASILSPDTVGIPYEYYSGPHALLGLANISEDVTQKPTPLFVCACGKSWCSTQGTMSATASGPKLGLAGWADHFTFDDESIAEFHRALSEWNERRPEG